MSQGRCMRCFKAKGDMRMLRDVVMHSQGGETELCKGCSYDLDTWIGFLLHYNLQVVPMESSEPEAPSKLVEAKKTPAS